MDKPQDEKIRKKRINFFTTVTLALICSIWLSADISTFSFMSALNVSSDFKVGDFYNRVSDLATVRRHSDKVVIVDIGSGGRVEIAEMPHMLRDKMSYDIALYHKGQDALAGHADWPKMIMSGVG